MNMKTPMLLLCLATLLETPARAESPLLLVNAPTRSSRLAGMSVDGSRLAYLDTSVLGSYTDAMLFDMNASTAQLVRRPVTRWTFVMAADVSADGKLVVHAGHDPSHGGLEAFVIDAETGLTQRSYSYPTTSGCQITGCRLSPNGKSLVVTTSNPDRLLLWNESGTLLPTSLTATLAPSGQVFDAAGTKFVFAQTSVFNGIQSTSLRERDVATGAITNLTCGSSSVRHEYATYDWTTNTVVFTVKVGTTTSVLRIPSGGPCSAASVIVQLAGSTVYSCAAAPRGNAIVVSTDFGPAPGFDVVRIDGTTGASTNLTNASFTVPPEAAWPDEEGDFAAYTHVNPTTGLRMISGVNMRAHPYVAFAGDGAPPPFTLDDYACAPTSWTDTHGLKIGQECTATFHASPIHSRNVLAWHVLRLVGDGSTSVGPFVVAVPAGDDVDVYARFQTPSCTPSGEFNSWLSFIQPDVLMDDVWAKGVSSFTQCECPDAPLVCAGGS